MGLTKPIPPKMRAEMAKDKFYSRCCLQSSECRGRIQWHHHLKWRGQRVNEKWAILPLCEHHHAIESHFYPQLTRIMVLRASEEELQKYSKAINYVQMRKNYLASEAIVSEQSVEGQAF